MKIKKGYVLREVAGGYYIIPVGAQSIDNSRMITVNETGKIIWEALQSDRDFDGLLKIMLDNYDVDESDLRADLNSFIDTLRGAELLED